jgi:hypothetical protein
MFRCRFFALTWPCFVLATFGCGGSQAASRTIGDDDAARTGAPEGWPRVLVATHGSGPALYLGPEGDAPAIGYVSPGVRVRLDGPPREGRVPVTVAGGLIARGWMPLGRVGAYLARRARLAGTPTYVGVGDLVSILGRNDDGSFRVEVAPWLGREENDRLGPWTATVPAEWLTSTRPEGPDTGLSQGENRRLPAGQSVEVFDRPNGRVVGRIPAADPPHTVVVLRSRNGWHGIRAGVGPYLVGYVRVELEPADGPPRATWSPPATREDRMPHRIAEDEGPLRRVRPGTRVRFLDRVIARLRSGGWARELGRTRDGRIDVYVAVDDASAVRGLVRARDLEDDGSAGSGGDDAP